MKRKLLFLFLGLFWLYFSVNAQERTISGKITDQEHNTVVPGVNVVLKGTTTGTTTNGEGIYTLKVPANGGSLIFSSIGYKTQEIAIGNKSVMDLFMLPDNQALSEVVVTALGIKREEKSLGYSLQKIDAKSMEQARETNFVNALTGKIAGVQITGASGNIGGSSRIIIRGIRSIDGNNQPLFVVDGTPVDNSNFNTDAVQGGEGGGRDFGNAIQDLNPDDIESISVLKGPSASALYGSRASNGVIMITTKGGKGQKGIGVSFNNTLTFDKVYVLPHYQNEYGGGYKQFFDTYSYNPDTDTEEYAAFDGQPFVNNAADESWGPRLDGQLVRQWYSWYPQDSRFGQMTPWVAHPDNIKNFYQTGITRTNSISLASSNDKSDFRLSFTNMSQTGTYPNSSLKRNNVGFSGNTKFDNKLSAGIKFNYVKNEAKGRPPVGSWNESSVLPIAFNTWFERQLDLADMKNYRFADGTIRNWNISYPTDTDPYYWNNPYFVLYENYSSDSRERVFGNVSLSYQLTDHLSISGFLRKDFYNDFREDRLAEGYIYQTAYEQEINKVDETNYELLLQYQKQISQQFSLSVTAGANARRQLLKRNYGRTRGGLSATNFFNLKASTDPALIDDYSSRRSVNSIYASASLGFRELIFVDVTGRNDWSSTLPTGNRSYFYPSVSTSLVFSELMQNLRWLSFGKIRAGWAQVGSDTDPYRLETRYSPTDNYGSQPVYYVPDIRNNSRLKPEISTSYEVGLETKFLGNRLSLDFTYYNNISTNQILRLPVSSTSGFSYTIINAGEVRNNGIEVAVSGTPVETPGGFTWDVGINWSRNRNKIVELAVGQTNYLLNSGYGLININAQVGQPYGVLTGDGFATDIQGRRLVDENGYYIFAQNKVLGSVLADFTGGFSNTFSYKGISFSTLIDFQKGGRIYSRTSSLGQYSGLTIETVGTNVNGNPKRNPVSEGGGVLSQGVLEDGTPNSTYIEAQDYYKYVSDIEEAHTYDASFVKLREMRLGYVLPGRWFQKTPIQSVTFALVARNVAILFKNVPHIDPEGALGSGNIQGMEENQLPSVRSIGFNLNVKL
ncbi:SusC/RagA family TonB-linked outer membrane protein [Cytophagaceae bacterium YF14B1]|uniref:SusC/RagA family TonB-linked outer membrane protein n=1 Tax=Xanthocytophaga flava TaxID=3048013 RepID=A0AAE3QUH8_9BACT|nr:SusC/RagA family TonB-linked outer membrane protein [Xanthocytophaga flavus]MDJ1483521.1 SusC/RagA family TonB-linked outer membrane protein [Xanthocytophaga flavus]